METSPKVGVITPVNPNTIGSYALFGMPNPNLSLEERDREEWVAALPHSD